MIWPSSGFSLASYHHCCAEPPAEDQEASFACNNRLCEDVYRPTWQNDRTRRSASAAETEQAAEDLCAPRAWRHRQDAAGCRVYTATPPQLQLGVWLDGSSEVSLKLTIAKRASRIPAG